MRNTVPSPTFVRAKAPPIAPETVSELAPAVGTVAAAKLGPDQV